METQINIEEKKTVYDIKCTYHSDMKCQNYDAEITGIEEENGKITLCPQTQYNVLAPAEGFVFNNSDPDRVIAIAQMIKSFAEMMKQINKSTIDVSDNS